MAPSKFMHIRLGLGSYLHKFQRLSSDPLVPETYALEYPTIEELLALLDANHHGTGVFLAAELLVEMRLAGMKHVDDLMMISEQNLYLSTRISPEKIQTIFDLGKMMINAVHERHKTDIVDLKRMRGDRPKLRTTMNLE